jgi:hypothetical protein
MYDWIKCVIYTMKYYSDFTKKKILSFTLSEKKPGTGSYIA